MGGEPPSSTIKADGDGPIIEFGRVSKSFGQRIYAVRDLDLHVHRNEFLTLLGPSGSGKTTTLMMLAGFDSPTSGSIDLDGQPITHLPPHRRNMGVVFQNYALFPHMSVAQNLAFPLETRGVRKDEIRSRVSQSLELVRLGDHAAKRPSQLSGGQQQRIALARALIFSPRIVLMDEPLSALDKHLRERMQLEIKALQRKLGITVVFVTHDQSEALVMSDRVAVFDHGRLQQVAAPNVLYDAPVNAFIAGFIGENNMLGGRLQGFRDGYARVAMNGAVFSGRPVGAIEPAEEVVLAVRPESLRIEPAGTASTNVMPATVEQLVYLGDHSRLRARVAGHPESVSIKLHDKKATAAFTIGSQVQIGWSADDCNVFKPYLPSTDHIACHNGRRT